MKEEIASYKIVLVGDSGVGKTNLLASFARRARELNLAKEPISRSQKSELQGEAQAPKIVNKFEQGYSESLPPTIGSEFYSTKLTHPTDGSRIRVQIWDTAGQERYRAIAPGHYRRAAGALLVYDCSKKKSLENAIEVWLPELDKWPLRSCVMLVGNKVDLVKDTEGIETKDAGAIDKSSELVSLTEHKEMSKKAAVAGSVRVSAKTGESVVDAFHRLVFHIHEQEQQRKRDENDKNTSQEYNSSMSLSYLQQGLDLSSSSQNPTKPASRDAGQPCQCG